MNEDGIRFRTEWEFAPLRDPLTGSTGRIRHFSLARGDAAQGVSGLTRMGSG